MKRIALFLLLVLFGCDESMDNQNRTRTLGSATGLPHWSGHGEALTPVPGTVARGTLARERALEQPPTVSLDVMLRGRRGYDINCAPCHGLTGAGDGFVVQRGFPAPKSLADHGVLASSSVDMLEIITHGKGVMYGFADRVEPADRWAIVAYMRALQLAAMGEETPP